MKFANPLKKTRTLSSVRGHSIEFPGRGSVTKDAVPEGMTLSADGLVFVYVPPIMRPECVAAGLAPDEEMVESDEVKGAVKPDDATKLKEAVFGAFDILVELNERESFTGVGVPKPGPVEKLLGYALTNSELKELWVQHRADRKERGL